MQINLKYVDRICCYFLLLSISLVNCAINFRRVSSVAFGVSSLLTKLSLFILLLLTARNVEVSVYMASKIIRVYLL